MNVKQQGELDIEQETLEGKKDQLIEIYKIHTQLTSHISNRRHATHRFYQILLSGLFLIFFTVLQRRDNAAFRRVFDGELTTSTFMLFIGGIGMCLSWVWFTSINSYLGMNSRKYKVLKELEEKLEFQFFTREWELIGKNGENTPYKRLANHELMIPIIFFLVFSGLYIQGLLNNTNQSYLLLIAFHAFFLIHIALTLFRSGHDNGGGFE